MTHPYNMIGLDIFTGGGGNLGGGAVECHFVF